MRTRRLLGIAGLLALVALAAYASPDRVLAVVRGLLHSPWFPLVLLVLYAVRPFLAWPITLLSALVGYEFGLAIGLPFALLGAVATSLIPFYAGRYLSTDTGFLGRLTGGSTAYFERTGGVRGVAAARLVPTPAEAISGAAGAGGVTLPAFTLGTLLGELPWTIAAVAIGAGLDRFTLAAVHLDPLLAAGLALAGLTAIAGPTYAWWRDR